MKIPCQPDKIMNIFICGGGTGGHFFSGVALAEKMLSLYPEARVIFVGTAQGIEARTKLTDPRMHQVFVRSAGLKGKSFKARLSGLLSMARGVLESFGLLLRYRPRWVIGVGGYASAPCLLAALSLRWLFRWRMFLLDQNSVPGATNRLFVRLSVPGFCAFEAPLFRVVDLPLRSDFVRLAKDARPFTWPPKRVLVMGGSQGARGLNDLWLQTWPRLKKEFPELTVTHQTGSADEVRVSEFYRARGEQAAVFAFTQDLPRHLAEADLVVCRAGAMSVFEVMAFERPALFVPFPAAADQHQLKNALAIQNSEWVMEEKAWNVDAIVELMKRRNPAVPRRQSQDVFVESWDRLLSLS
jgi:UDP-N-acetylglucosamine--N-acetylmuramyl-(pentapeptide) pyrophosphoryl-undecaprenol N-acetylglucosamine transferase